MLRNIQTIQKGSSSIGVPFKQICFLCFSCFCIFTISANAENDSAAESNRAGINAFRNKQYEQAEQHYRNALKSLDEKNGGPDELRASVLTNYSILLDAEEKKDEAKRIMQQAEDILRKLGRATAQSDEAKTQNKATNKQPSKSSTLFRPVTSALKQPSLIVPEAMPKTVSLRGKNASKDKTLEFEDYDDKSKQEYFIVVKPNLTIEAMVQLKVDLQNMEASKPLPYNFIVDGPSSIPVLKLRPKVDGPHKFSYTFDSMVGKPYQSIIDRNYKYALPFEAGQSFRVSQTHFGKISHYNGSQNEYAVDFSMPIGTTVCAARDGVVVAAKCDSSEGGADKDRYIDAGNFIIIRHPDGSYGKYWHLQCGGCIAKIGQSVSKGQAIGLSGNTGFTSGPHLHFEVYDIKSATWKDSIPANFETDKGVISKLEEGQIYQKP